MLTLVIIIATIILVVITQTIIQINNLLDKANLIRMKRTADSNHYKHKQNKKHNV